MNLLIWYFAGIGIGIGGVGILAIWLAFRGKL